MASDNDSLATIISELASAGAPLESGLRAAAEEVGRGPLKQSLLELANHLDRGEDLTDAVAATDGAPSWLQGFVAVGLRGNQLGQVLTSVMERQSRLDRQRRRLTFSLLYPGTILLLATILTLFVGTRIVVDTKQVFAEFNAQLPFNTLLFIRFMSVGHWVMLAFPIVLALVVVCRFSVGAARWNAMLAELPLFGILRKWAAASQFSQLLAILVKLDVPLPTALRLVQGAMTDPAAAHVSRQIAEEVDAGKSLTQSVQQQRFCPDALANFVAWGEQHDSLADSLQTATDAFDGMLQIRAETLRSIVPPIAFVGVCLHVVFLYSAILLPLITTFNNLM